jgi:hypothetical protein
MPVAVRIVDYAATAFTVLDGWHGRKGISAGRAWSTEMTVALQISTSTVGMSLINDIE